MKPLAVLVASDFCSPLAETSVPVGLDELVEQARRGFAQVLAEFAEANDGVLAFGLLDPDLVRLRGSCCGEQGNEGEETFWHDCHLIRITPERMRTGDL